MLKRDEIEDTNSYLNKAHDGERLFVLLARDLAAPVAIRAWITERIRLGKNAPGDEQIREAYECAALMELERREIEDEHECAARMELEWSEIEAERRQGKISWVESGDVP